MLRPQLSTVCRSVHQLRQFDSISSLIDFQTIKSEALSGLNATCLKLYSQTQNLAFHCQLMLLKQSFSVHFLFE